MSSEYEGMTAVLYARVSTDDKDQRPESQLEVMKDWCQRKGIVVVGKYVDELSGKDMDRPQFQALLGRIVTGFISPVVPGGARDPGTCKINLLVAWKQSRITRDQTDWNNIKGIVESYGCVIRFVGSDVEAETSTGRLITNIDAWKDQEFRKDLSEHTRMGMIQRKAAGQHLSRPMRLIIKED